MGGGHWRGAPPPPPQAWSVREAFAPWLYGLLEEGGSRCTFVIGGVPREGLCVCFRLLTVGGRALLLRKPHTDKRQQRLISLPALHCCHPVHLVKDIRDSQVTRAERASQNPHGGGGVYPSPNSPPPHRILQGRTGCRQRCGRPRQEPPARRGRRYTTSPSRG